PQDSAPAASSGNAAAAAQNGGMKTRVFELEKEVISLQEKLSGMRMERNDIQEKSDRRLKDFESYKYRMDRERRGSFITQIGSLAVRHSMVRVTPTPAPAKKSEQKEAKDEPEISDTTATTSQPTNLAIEAPPSDADQA